KIIRSRGGEPVRSPLGGFVAVRDGRAGLGAPELAVRPGGPPLLAAGAYLRVCVDAAEGRIPSARQSVEHALLRREVGEGALVATIVPTVEQRQGLLEELDARGATGSPLGAVRAASLGVELGDPLRGRAVVRCDRPGACAELAALLDRARAAGSGDGAPDAALGPLLGAMQLAATADALQITATLPAQEAVQLATRLLGGAPGR
ncbi:MAG: hypothetical protein HY744_28310, partial [Deltaproteobacteria bacterium]|nr:hypothetical protein [Deltaproteobacteria bacterium]